VTLESPPHGFTSKRLLACWLASLMIPVPHGENITTTVMHNYVNRSESASKTPRVTFTRFHSTYPLEHVICKPHRIFSDIFLSLGESLRVEPKYGFGASRSKGRERTRQTAGRCHTMGCFRSWSRARSLMPRDNKAYQFREHSAAIRAPSVANRERLAELSEHSATIREHSIALTEHLAALSEHSAALREHLAVIREHLAAIREHLAANREQSAALSEKLAEHSGNIR